MVRLRRALAPSSVMLLAVIAACSSDPQAPVVDPVEGVADACDPLVPERCGFPMPNDFWRVEAGGRPHLSFGSETLPSSLALGKHVDPSVWNTHDGFSPGEELVTILEGATGQGLVGQDQIERSLASDSPTVLIDASTGERVPHWAEIDLSTHRDDDQSLIVHPAVRLKDGTRYVAAIRHVVDADGKPIAPSRAFSNLRDKGARSRSAAFEARRTHFEDIFATLAKAGVARSDLQVAWDFTTASTAQNTRDMLAIRDAALLVVGSAGPAYRITKVEDAPNAHTWKRVTGMMTVPLFLDVPTPGGRIVRDGSGAPKQNGTAEYEFVMIIPNAIQKGNPLGILQNGHGLLGSKSEGVDGYFAQICDEYGYVGIAVDWVGMAHEDDQTLIDAASGELSKFEAAVDRQHQGFANALLAMRMMKGRMVDEPLLQLNGKKMVDPARAYYRGDSQGGIFGTTYMAISTDVTRGLLGEPGSPYTLLLDRSVDFSGYKFLLKGSFPNGRDLRLAYALLQMSWDRSEPDGYVPFLSQSTLPGTPKHDVLLHVAIGDHQVSPLGAHIIARAVGAKNLGPVNRTVFGVPTTDGPLVGSAMVEFDFHNPPVPIANMPPADPSFGPDPHDLVRVLRPALDQEDHFFRTGEVRPFCNGPCDPQ